MRAFSSCACRDFIQVTTLNPESYMHKVISLELPLITKAKK